MIKVDFIQILRCQLERLHLIDSDTLAATRLASKVEGIPAIDELRPISLLNCDYKILTKMLVKRLIPILKYVIRSGQLCTVEKKNILFGVSNIMSSILFTKEKKMGAAVISLDFFKAYDRVFLPFLLAVMRKMNFSSKFCSWIEMLHKDAKTMFILQKLTDPIKLSFSIRQGDPLSMLLYIIYIEPLLLYLERKMGGLRFENVKQCLDAYCDDVNVVTNQVADFGVLDEAVRKFESVSGAILSRNKKCIVMGFRTWKDNVD